MPVATAYPKHDIGIAGCGIAGLAAALILHHQGHTVTIYDQMPSPGPVGSGLVLQPTGLAVLKHLGLLDSILGKGHKIERMFGLAGKKPILDVRYSSLRPGSFGLAIHRASLFDILYKTVSDASIPIHFSAPVIAKKHNRFVFENQETSPPFAILIDALGAGSPLSPGRQSPLAYGALWATLDWHDADGFARSALEQRYVKACKMAGVLPVGTLPDDNGEKLTFFWSLKHQDYAAWLENGLPQWKDEVLSIWPQTEPVLAQIHDPDQLTLARYYHHTQSPPYNENLIHIGDSYHAASPQLGQGANMALLDAYAFGEAMKSDPAPAVIFKAYHRLRRRHVRLYQFFAWAFTPVYQSDQNLIPFMRDHLVPPLAKIPPIPKLLAKLVSGEVGNPLKKLGLNR